MKKDIPKLKTLHPEPVRDWRASGVLKGGYKLPNPEGGISTYTRATNLAHMHEDHESIVKWEKRKALEGLALDRELLDTVPDLCRAIEEAGDDWRTSGPLKRKLDDLAEKSIDRAGARDRTEWGSLLHNLTEWWDAGRFEEVRPTVESWGDQGKLLMRDVEAYDATMKELGLVCPVEHIERVCINLTCSSGGTMDRLVRLPDGRLVVGDLKTGAIDEETIRKFGISGFAVQFAEYAFADGLLSADRKSIEPMPAELDPTTALVIILPFGSGQCTVRQFSPEEMELGWAIAQHAAATIRLRELGKQITGHVYDPTSVISPVGLLSEITHAETTGHLNSIWTRLTSAQRAAVWTQEHTDAAIARKAELARLR